MNNNKKTITVCSIIALIILAIVVIVTLISDLTGFSIVFGTFFVILTICLAIYLREEPDEFNAFIKTKKRILRTYDSVIVEVEDIPNIAGKNIIKVKSIEDLVDAQLELREPIYYKNDNDSCFFILLHFNEACIYVLRMNDSVVSPTEQSIRYMKEETPDKTKEQENILENLEKTVVYKLDELRSFRISPIRNNEKINVVDDTAIKKGIEEAKEQEITSSALSSEISKTMYLKDLRERMLKYEEEQMSKTKELAATKEEVKVKEEVPEKVEAPVEEKEVEVSPIERLRKMVKEQEQSLTKELHIKEEAEKHEEEKQEEIVKEEVKEEEVSTIKNEDVHEDKNQEKENEEENDIKLQIMDDTDAKNEVEQVEAKHEKEKAVDDEDLMDQIVVLHSLDEEDEHVTIEDDDDDEVITHVIVEDNLENEEDEDDVLSKEIERHSTMEIKVVDETSEIATVDVDDEDTDENEDEEITEVSEIAKIDDDNEETEISVSAIEEDDIEEEIEDEVEEDNDEEVVEEEKVQEQVVNKTTRDVNKPRRTTRPTRKVTHSTRRAQKHTNRKR